MSDHTSPSVGSFLYILAGGEDPGKLNHAMLKNGHTTPIGSATSSSPVQAEEEPGRIAGLRKPVPEEEPKKRLGKKLSIFECKSHDHSCVNSGFC